MQRDTIRNIFWNLQKNEIQMYWLDKYDNTIEMHNIQDAISDLEIGPPPNVAHSF